MKSKLSLLALLCALFVGAFADARAQTAAVTEKPVIAIVTYVTYPILDDSITGIKESLAQAGYDKNTARILELNANGEQDKLGAIAREVVQMKPAVIVPVSTPVSKALITASPATQRIVYSTVTNPSNIGMDAKPRNVTGVADVVDFEANLALILSLFPKTKTIGMPVTHSEANAEFGAREMQRMARAKGIEVKVSPVTQPSEAVDAARALLGQVDVIYIGSDNQVASAVPGISRVAHERGIPVFASDEGSVREGALASVSVNYVAVGRKAGSIAAEVVRTGKMPGEIPAVRFMGDSLIINEKAAAVLKFTFPAAVRQKAATVVR